MAVLVPAGRLKAVYELPSRACSFHLPHYMMVLLLKPHVLTAALRLHCTTVSLKFFLVQGDHSLHARSMRHKLCVYYNARSFLVWDSHAYRGSQHIQNHPPHSA
jgi:hypothetical protein